MKVDEHTHWVRNWYPIFYVFYLHCKCTRFIHHIHIWPTFISIKREKVISCVFYAGSSSRLLFENDTGRLCQDAKFYWRPIKRKCAYFQVVMSFCIDGVKCISSVVKFCIEFNYCLRLVSNVQNLVILFGCIDMCVSKIMIRRY